MKKPAPHFEVEAIGRFTDLFPPPTPFTLTSANDDERRKLFGAWQKQMDWAMAELFQGKVLLVIDSGERAGCYAYHV